MPSQELLNIPCPFDEFTSQKFRWLQTDLFLSLAAENAGFRGLGGIEGIGGMEDPILSPKIPCFAVP
jgi:hypothetical protein